MLDDISTIQKISLSSKRALKGQREPKRTKKNQKEPKRAQHD
jgi:hypothetical protein